MILIIMSMGICFLLFSAALNVMSYRRMIAETYVHESNLNTVGIVRKLNYALSFGKPLDKFYGLEKLLENTKNQSDSILAIEVWKEKDFITGIGSMIEHEPQSSAGEEYIIKKNGIISFVDFDGGQLVLRLDVSIVQKAVRNYMVSAARLDILLLVIILFILGILCFLWKSKEISVHKLKMTSLFLLIGVQLLFGIYSTGYTIHSYRNSILEISQAAVNTVSTDINEVLGKGMRYHELTGLDEYLNKLCDNISELSKIEFVLEKKETKDIEVYEIPIDDESIKKGYVVCKGDQKIIQKKILNHMIDVIILIMVTIFISLEMIGFISNHIEQHSRRKKEELYLPGFRLFVFVSGVAFSLDCGFISILSNRLYEQMALPDHMSFLSGMPNTMYSLAIVLGLFGCSFFIAHIGMKRTLLLGIGMGVVGYLFCAISVSLPLLIAARFIFGFCDGLVINAVRLYASAQKDKELHNKILVTYLAAINLGVCCSVVIGGLVADVTSYTAVFLLGAILGIFCLFLVDFSGFNNEKGRSKMSFLAAVLQLKIRRVFVFMVFLIIPIYIATLYVGYTFPLYGDEIGFSNSLVSGCLMINYLIIAYLTDPISEWVNHHLQPKKAVVFYVILQTISIGIFVVFANVWTAILALILTSIWDCFGMVVIDSVLDDVKGSSTEQNTLLQMLFGKIGMVIGPIIVTAGLGRGAAAATGSIVIVLIIGMMVYLLLGNDRAERRTL